MSIFLTDNEIQELIQEPKSVNLPLASIGANLKQKRGHREAELKVVRIDGSEFRIIIRQSLQNALDFSVVLGFAPVTSNEVFLLRRYNGRSHEHQNRLENEAPFYDFHIHTATERYQREGFKPEFYAEVTNRYADISGAIDCLINDCSVSSDVAQASLLFN